MEIISNIALISINETMFVQLISFLIFLFVINRVMFRPLQSVMGERADHIEQLQLEVADAEKQFQAVTDQLKVQEKAAKKEAAALLEELEAAGNKQAEEIFAAVSKETAGLKAKVKAEVALQIAEARKQIATESEILAVSIMEKILDRRLVK